MALWKMKKDIVMAATSSEEYDYALKALHAMADGDLCGYKRRANIAVSMLKTVSTKLAKADAQ